MGRRQDEGVGPAERRPRAVGRPQRLRLRLDERQVLHGGGVAAGLPDSRHADRLDARHQRPRPRRGRPRHRDDAGRSAEIRRQAEGQVDPRRRRAPDVAAFWTAPATPRRPPRSSQRMELAANPGARVRRRQPERRRTRRRRAAASAGGGFNRNDWFKTEGVAGLLSTAPRGHGIYTIGGGTAPPIRPARSRRSSIPAEQYGRLARMVAKNIPGHDRGRHQEHLHPQPADVQRRRRNSAAPTRPTRS